MNECDDCDGEGECVRVSVDVCVPVEFFAQMAIQAINDFTGGNND